MKFLLLFFSLSLFGADEHDKLPGGVLSFDHHSGMFQLHPNAIKNFEIECSSFVKGSIPHAAIIRSKGDEKVYRCQKDSYQAVSLEQLAPQDHIVTRGGNYLKTVELSLEEGPAEGHGH